MRRGSMTCRIPEIPQGPVGGCSQLIPEHDSQLCVSPQLCVEQSHVVSLKLAAVGIRTLWTQADATITSAQGPGEGTQSC